MEINEYIYSPAIRTRRAELEGLRHLTGDPLSAGLLPLFELTRSRRTKANPEGSISQSLRDVLEICDGERFVLDLTTQASLLNGEIDRLLDPDQNFDAWVAWCSRELPSNSIPVVHLTAPFDERSFRSQCDSFLNKFQNVAIRIPSDFDDLKELCQELERGGGQVCRKSMVYIDLGLLTSRGVAGAKARVAEVIDAFSEKGLAPAVFLPTSTSFPSTVTPFGDVNGQFPLQEVLLSDWVKDEYDGDGLTILHGDYACIHAFDQEGRAINWVPRVDVPLDSSLFYYRYRRHEGGYVRAATSVLSDPRYQPINCWGDSAIRNAASGNPDGKAPAFWISVRLNIHLQRQLIRLGA